MNLASRFLSILAVVCLVSLLSACAQPTATPAELPEQTGIAQAGSTPTTQPAGPTEGLPSPVPEASIPAEPPGPTKIAVEGTATGQPTLPSPDDTGPTEPVTQATLDLSGDSRLPIFVEMIQAPLSPDLSPQMPPADTSPSGVYVYNPAERSLLVTPEMQILPTTEILVGLTSATTPGRPYVASDLFQIPAAESAEPAPLRVVAVDAASGTITLAYADQTFELAPGQSRSFKQSGEGELAILEMTTITNYGHLAAIGPLPPDPGTR